jgi:hypothetical protein
MPADKMNDAVVSAAKSGLSKNLIGIRNEIAIGKKQKLDQLDDVAITAAGVS